MKPKHITPSLVLIICGQALILSIAYSSLFAYISQSYRIVSPGTLKLILIISFFFVIVTTAYGIIVSSSLSRKETAFDGQNLYINDMTQLLQALKSQRHDFANNIQTIYGLIAIECYQEAKEYLERTIKEVKELSRVTGFKTPVVSALLQAKSSVAKSRDIDFEILPLSDLANLAVDYYDLSRILGNLLDNAFDAVAITSDEQRKVWINIHEDVTSYSFEIGNLGSPIPDELKHQIFEAGLSTKNGENRGMGLSIVKSLMEKNSGRIQCTSTTEKGTIFTLIFNKNQEI